MKKPPKNTPANTLRGAIRSEHTALQTKPARNIISLRLKHRPFKFTTRAPAVSFADHAVKLHAVVMGDDNRFGVVCMADFERLMRAGYGAA